MKIEHLGLWVQDLELMRSFYVKYFDTSSGEKYVNPKTQFQSYFILFGDGKTRLELMMRPDIMFDNSKRGFNMGIAHFAISVGGKDSGDGYYETVVLDPEGNYLEISA